MRRTEIVVLVALLAGCRSSENAAPKEVAGPPTPAASEPAPAATPPTPARPPAPPPAPSSDEREIAIEPRVQLSEFEKAAAALTNPDEILVPSPEIVVVIDYPLSEPAELALKAPPGGFTRKALVLAIGRAYRELYAEEERRAKVKTVPREKRRGLLNRNRTDGPHGIWGHDLEDLVLRSIIVSRDPTGKTIVELGIDS